ncbi:MAG: hypothetical protein JW828_05360 [Sedimentisphaerales bacterium]|nr:hypothetical protein [Sedimentisphaerales bacterium]
MVNGLQEKSLRLAIQLNLVFPGFGCFYIGKNTIGVAAILIMIGTWASTGLEYILHAYIAMNAVMAVDLFIWNSRKKEKPVDGA